MFLVIKDLTITKSDNTFGNGGGMQNDYGGTVTVSDSTFSNLFAAAGGAIANGYGGSGTAMITNSTFSNDNADFGGAVNNGSGTMSITDSTFNGGDVRIGAAVDNADPGSGTVSITDSTLSGGEAVDGGEVDTSYGGRGVLVVADSTLHASSGSDLTAGSSGRVFVAGDVFGTGCQPGGTWTDDGFNAAPDTSCFSAGTGDVDAGSVAALKLGSLADNGGPTQTIALGAGSAAIGVIPNPTSVTLNGQSVKLCRAPISAGWRGRGTARRRVMRARLDPAAASLAQITVPAAGQLFTAGQSVSESFSCSEGSGGPGMSSCVDQAHHPSGAGLDTASAVASYVDGDGDHKDGLIGTAHVSYTVVVASPLLSVSAPASGTAGRRSLAPRWWRRCREGFADRNGHVHGVRSELLGAVVVRVGRHNGGVCVGERKRERQPVRGFTPASAGKYWWCQLQRGSEQPGGQLGVWGGDGRDGGFGAQRRRRVRRTGGSGGTSGSGGAGGSGGPGGPGPTSGPARWGVPAASAGGGSGTLQIGPATVSGTLVRFSMSCAGVAGATCSGRARAVRARDGEGPQDHRGRAEREHGQPDGQEAKEAKEATTKTIVLGTATVTLQALQSETVRIALDGAGKRLLQQHHNLKVSLAFTANGKTVTITRSRRAQSDHAQEDPPSH